MSYSNRDTIEQPPPLSRSRSRLSWLLVVLGLALFLAVPTFLDVRWFSATSEPTAAAQAQEPSVIASYRADFLPEHPKTGWHYYWNANGPPGDTNGYLALVWNGTLFATTELPLPAPAPARYLRLSATGGHPGQGPSQTGSRGVHHEHPAIVAFTVPDAGSYAIGHSRFIKTSKARQCLRAYLVQCIYNVETGTGVLAVEVPKSMTNGWKLHLNIPPDGAGFLGGKYAVFKF